MPPVGEAYGANTSIFFWQVFPSLPSPQGTAKLLLSAQMQAA